MGLIGSLTATFISYRDGGSLRGGGQRCRGHQDARPVAVPNATLRRAACMSFTVQSRQCSASMGQLQLAEVSVCGGANEHRNVGVGEQWGGGARRSRSTPTAAPTAMPMMAPVERPPPPPPPEDLCPGTVIPPFCEVMPTLLAFNPAGTQA